MLESASPSATEIFPFMVDTTKDFCGSIFSNRETEKLVRDIVILQQKKDPRRWTTFNVKEYHEVCGCCDPIKREVEEEIFHALVYGGPPSARSSCKDFEPGYLKSRGPFYQISQKFIEALVPFLKKQTFSCTSS